jgi:hypothetical protein
MVAARVLASPLIGTFDAALRQTTSRSLPAACYRVLRRLPGRDFHPLDHRDLTSRYRIAPGLARLQDAPWRPLYCARIGHDHCSVTEMPSRSSIIPADQDDPGVPRRAAPPAATVPRARAPALEQLAKLGRRRQR